MKVTYTVVNGEVLSENRSGVKRDYLPGPLGSTVALLDNTQTQTDTFSYWPYGENNARTGTTATPFQFVGTLGYRLWDDQNIAQESNAGLIIQVRYTNLPSIWGGKFGVHQSGGSSFYLPDFQGHTRQLTNISQAVTDTLLLDAWGREIASTGTTVNPFRAFGQWGYYRDLATRLYVQARHYDVTNGRWMSRDPIGFDGGEANNYLYASNSPVSRVDPTGLAAAPVNPCEYPKVANCNTEEFGICLDYCQHLMKPNKPTNIVKCYRTGPLPDPSGEMCPWAVCCTCHKPCSRFRGTGDPGSALRQCLRPGERAGKGKGPDDVTDGCGGGRGDHYTYHTNRGRVITVTCCYCHKDTGGGQLTQKCYCQ